MTSILKWMEYFDHKGPDKVVRSEYKQYEEFLKLLSCYVWSSSETPTKFEDRWECIMA
jgi:hypothetical protein